MVTMTITILSQLYPYWSLILQPHPLVDPLHHMIALGYFLLIHIPSALLMEYVLFAPLQLHTLSCNADCILSITQLPFSCPSSQLSLCYIRCRQNLVYGTYGKKWGSSPLFPPIGFVSLSSEFEIANHHVFNFPTLNRAIQPGSSN